MIGRHLPPALQVQVQVPPFALSFFVVCDNSAHGVMENWDPSHFPGCAPAWYNPKRYDNTT